MQLSKKLLKNVDMVGNILDVYRVQLAKRQEYNEGLVWYPYALSLCVEAAQELSIDIRTFVGIVAASSPRLSWDRNIVVAIRVTNRLKEGRDREGLFITPDNFAKAKRIFSGENPEDVLGQKTKNFFRNILGCTYSVTIDAHACNVALYGAKDIVSGDLAPSPVTYEIVAEAYRKAAAIAGIAPSEIQSITWMNKAKNGGKVA